MDECSVVKSIKQVSALEQKEISAHFVLLKVTLYKKAKNEHFRYKLKIVCRLLHSLHLEFAKRIKAFVQQSFSKSRKLAGFFFHLSTRFINH